MFVTSPSKRARLEAVPENTCFQTTWARSKSLASSHTILADNITVDVRTLPKPMIDSIESLTVLIHVTVTSVSILATIVAEAIFIALTWIRTWDIYMTSRRLGFYTPLTTLLLRDGEFPWVLWRQAIHDFFLQVHFISGKCRTMCGGFESLAYHPRCWTAF